MKLLMFHCPEFWYRPYEKMLESGEPTPSEQRHTEAVVVFYHGETKDLERRKSVLTKILKNIKWLAGKFETRSVVLHSFNHLSVSKADPEFIRELAGEVRNRLESVGYSVAETPFGWLNEWCMHVGGESLAKVFKDI